MRTLPLCLLLAAAPLSAQETMPWRLSDFPYLMGDPTNGLLVIGHIQLAREADYDARFPFDGYLGAEAAYGTRGSRFLTVKFRAPAIIPRWRFAFDAGAVREGKFGYFGQGPEGEGGLVDGAEDLGSDFFRVKRTRYFARGEVTRHVVSKLHAVVSAGIAHYRYSPTDESDAFRTDFFDEPLTGTDATGRLSLVFDTRDKEFVPAKGFMVEAGLLAGSGRAEQRVLAPGGGGPVASFSGKGYTGAYAHVRGFFSPRIGTTLGGRLAIRSLGKNAPLDAQYQMPGWERDLTVFGGADSHRSFIRGRFVGRGMLFSSFEVRHTLLDVGDYGGITALGFLDAGRAFAEAPSLTLKRWRVGGGVGLGVRVVRFALLTFNFATGPDGFTFSMSNGLAF